MTFLVTHGSLLYFITTSAQHAQRVQTKGSHGISVMEEDCHSITATATWPSYLYYYKVQLYKDTGGTSEFEPHMKHDASWQAQRPSPQYRVKLPVTF